MSPGSQQDRGIRAVIGVAALAGSLVLLYFSARPTLSCTTGSGPGVDCAVRASILGVVDVADDRIGGVQSAEMVASAVGNSRTPPHMMFVANGARHDLGYFSQLFVKDVQAIDQFARNPASPELRLGRPIDGQAIGAHAAALFLAAVGVGMLFTAVRRPRSDRA